MAKEAVRTEGRKKIHWQENLVKFLDDGIVTEADATNLLSKCRKALGLPRYRVSTAVVVKLERSVSKDYDHRDFWGDNDTLVAIIRNRKVATVMLTRSGQVHKRHFRTDEIFS